MIKKTKTIYTKKRPLKKRSLKTRHLKTRHLKTRHLKKRHLKKSYTRRYKKRHPISKLNTLPGSQGVPMFSAPTIHPSNKIYIDSDHKESGNIIPGLRTYLGKN
jgi:hypothetical protein